MGVVSPYVNSRSLISNCVYVICYTLYVIQLKTSGSELHAIALASTLKNFIKHENKIMKVPHILLFYGSIFSLFLSTDQFSQKYDEKKIHYYRFVLISFMIYSFMFH